MSEMKHLKGPYRIVEREVMEDGSIFPRHIATVEGDYVICYLESPSMAALGYGRTPAEQERDRLLAACPELLAALRLAVRQNSHDMLMTAEELRQCEAALSKAAPKGEESNHG